MPPSGVPKASDARASSIFSSILPDPGISEKVSEGITKGVENTLSDNKDLAGAAAFLRKINDFFDGVKPSTYTAVGGLAATGVAALVTRHFDGDPFDTMVLGSMITLAISVLVEYGIVPSEYIKDFISAHKLILGGAAFSLMLIKIVSVLERYFSATEEAKDQSVVKTISDILIIAATGFGLIGLATDIGQALTVLNCVSAVGRALNTLKTLPDKFSSLIEKFDKKYSYTDVEETELSEGFDGGRGKKNKSIKVDFQYPMCCRDGNEKTPWEVACSLLIKTPSSSVSRFFYKKPLHPVWKHVTDYSEQGVIQAAIDNGKGQITHWFQYNVKVDCDELFDMGDVDLCWETFVNKLGKTDAEFLADICCGVDGAFGYVDFIQDTPFIFAVSPKFKLSHETNFKCKKLCFTIDDVVEPPTSLTEEAEAFEMDNVVKSRWDEVWSKSALMVGIPAALCLATLLGVGAFTMYKYRSSIFDLEEEEKAKPKKKDRKKKSKKESSRPMVEEPTKGQRIAGNKRKLAKAQEQRDINDAKREIRDRKGRKNYGVYVDDNEIDNLRELVRKKHELQENWRDAGVGMSKSSPEERDRVYKQFEQQWRDIVRQIHEWYDGHPHYVAKGNAPGKVLLESSASHPDLVEGQLCFEASASEKAPSKQCCVCGKEYLTRYPTCSYKCNRKKKKSEEVPVKPGGKAPKQKEEGSGPLKDKVKEEKEKKGRRDEEKKKNVKPPPVSHPQIDRKIMINQAPSKYNTYDAHSAFHDSMFKIFSKKLNPNDDHWCGQLSKLTIGGKAKYVITKHQLVDDVYVMCNKKQTPLKHLGWVPITEDNPDLMVLPGDKLQLQGKALPTRQPPTQTVAGLFVTIDPLSKKEQLGTTEVYYDSTIRRLVHSCTTRNYSCGSLLVLDGEVVGVHNNSFGPDKSGENNLCLPLF